MNQIKFVEKNYRKLFSIIQDQKMKLLRNQQSNRNYFVLSIEFSSFQFSITSIFALDLAFVLTFISISTQFLIFDQKSVNQKNVEEYYKQTSSQTLESISNQSSYQLSYQQNFITYSRELILLEKIFRNENKFDITNDNFDFKIMIFYDKCNYTNLS